MDHNLYALDAQTGARRWKTPDLGGALASAPFYQDGVCSRALQTNKCWRLMQLPGKLSGLSTLPAGSGLAAFQDGILYFGDLEGNLYAVDAKLANPCGLSKQMELSE
jgi:outer membrane protein assembly factor BamB